MEEASSSTNPTLFQLLGLITFLSGPIISTWGKGLGKCVSRLWSSLQYRLELGNSSNTLRAKNKNPESDLQVRQNSTFDEKRNDGDCICREDVEMVMKKLGLCCSGEVPERFAAEETTRLFEEEEPSLEEVKAAFDVFDANADGFIDAEELQRVFCRLGLSEGKEMEDCKVIIRAFDLNGDERIDFREFLKFMESCFC